MRYRVEKTYLRFHTLPVSVFFLLIALLLYPIVGAFKGIKEGLSDWCSDVNTVYQVFITEKWSGR